MTHTLSLPHTRTVMPEILFDLDWVARPMSTLKEYDKKIIWSIHDPRVQRQSNPLHSLENQHTFLTSAAVKCALERRRETKGQLIGVTKAVAFMCLACTIWKGERKHLLRCHDSGLHYRLPDNVIEAWHTSFTHTLCHKRKITGQEQKRGRKHNERVTGGVFQTVQKRLRERETQEGEAI